ncbi:NAD(P)/FAD-dependent oxidoreductase [Jatrophihabitans sp.]|uniref:NAD(P)/FAD-dependent oxidoreductase n=1 Tax=Jatrophihabitans sp. TaxID=1932789 RepID=UPI002C871631|nr:FAD-dependent oxidoreductase [Jatrophihabitans sp.]
MSGRREADRAVVLGGSVAGLLAARVLAETFAEVLVLDRNTLLGGPAARHAQLLLGRGQQIVAELFPGLAEDAVAAGSPIADLAAVRHYVGGQRVQPVATGAFCVAWDRSALDSQLAARVQALPNVRLREHTDVLGLEVTADAGRVRGVRVRSRRPGSGVEVLEADLVVDAGGRGSNTPDWLADLGYGRPAEERIPVGRTFTSRHYRLRDEAVLDGDLGIEVAADAGQPVGALLLHLGHGRCVLTLTGPAGGPVPSTPASALAWTRALPVPDVYSALAGARPLDDVVTEEFAGSLRRRYEQLDRLPERLLVVGDAVGSINPVYRQGMTVAAQQALLLREHLQYGLPQPLVFAKDVSVALDVPWNMAAGADLELAGMAGACSEDVEVSAAFLARVRAGATRDPVLAKALLRVTGLLDSPETLMTPDIVARAMGPAPRRS